MMITRATRLGWSSGQRQADRTAEVVNNQGESIQAETIDELPQHRRMGLAANR